MRYMFCQGFKNSQVERAVAKISVMKFILRSVRNGCRLGTLTEPRLGKEMESPFCMLYSKAGCIPYLTRDMFEKITGLPSVVHMPSNLLLEYADTVKEFKAGIRKFTALEDFIVYFQLQDSAVSVPKGYNDSAGIAVWGQGGKKKLDAQCYMDIVETFQPDWFQALADSDTDRESSKKRIHKSLEKTLDYLDDCINRKVQSERLKDSAIIGVIEGGYSRNDRLRSAKETAKRPVGGFSLEGFHNFGPETETFRMSDIEELLKDTLAELPEDKPRFLPGVYHPLEVIRAVRLGCDVFDSTFPYVVTERGCAMVFSLSASEVTSWSQDDVIEVSLRDKKFQDCFKPLLTNCTCYACQNFTSAYVHHLLSTSEILGSLLLMIHNFHHYFQFFKALRGAITSEKLDAFEEYFKRISCHSQETNSNPVAVCS